MDFEFLAKCLLSEIEHYLEHKDVNQLQEVLIAGDNEYRNIKIGSTESFKPVHRIKVKGVGEIVKIIHEGDYEAALRVYFKNMKFQLDGNEIIFGNRHGIIVDQFEMVPDEIYGSQKIFPINQEYKDNDYIFIFDDKMFYGWMSCKYLGEIIFKFKNTVAISSKKCYNDGKRGIYEFLCEKT